MPQPADKGKPDKEGGGGNGGPGPDPIVGDDGDTFISGTAGADIIYGGAGSDTIFGFEGDDVIYGEAGDDMIMPGTGEDTVYGGDGTNFVVYDFVFVEEPTFTEGKGKDKGSVQITYTYLADGELITETDTLYGVDALTVSYTVDSSGTAGLIDMETGTLGFYEADTEIGSGVIGLSDNGIYLIATTLTGVFSGGVEDARDRVADSGADGDTDLEFEIFNDDATAAQGGTSHEINVQSSFGLAFDVDSFEIEGLDEGEQVILSIVYDDGSQDFLNDVTGLADDGLVTATELEDAGIATTDIDQFILETNDGSSIYLDDLIVA